MAEFWVWSSMGAPSGSAELIARARKLSGVGDRVVVLAPEGCAAPPAGEDTLIRIRAAGSAVVMAAALAQAVRRRRPEAMFFSAGLRDGELAAALAAELDTGLSADCTELFMDAGTLVMRRPAHGGGVIADIVCRRSRPQLATVRHGAFPVFAAPERARTEELFIPSALLEDPIRVISREIEASGKSLRDATIVVSGGLGVGSRANFGLIRELADAMGGVAGASRAAVDAGYADWRSQVGQTGAVVHPRLYIAFGISGAVQHIAGMHGAERVLAVNTDEKAPIFDYADLAVTGDWKAVAEGLLREYRK